MNKTYLESMSLTALSDHIKQNKDTMDSQTKLQISTELGQRVSSIARMWDLMEGIDPNNTGRYGMAQNRKSHTYKLRKAAGFTYP